MKDNAVIKGITYALLTITLAVLSLSAGATTVTKYHHTKHSEAWQEKEFTAERWQTQKMYINRLPIKKKSQKNTTLLEQPFNAGEHRYNGKRRHGHNEWHFNPNKTLTIAELLDFYFETIIGSDNFDIKKIKFLIFKNHHWKTPTEVPVPAAAILFSSALLSLGFSKRFKKNEKNSCK